MKKTALLFAVLFFGVYISAQELKHDAVAINIEIPVRVFKGSTFIDNLTIEDFEIYENGVLQKIEAVYLIKKTEIKRKEELQKFNPKTSRNFYLFFEIGEYTPKMGEAFNYFVNQVLLPNDTLTIITPMKTYRMKKETLKKIPKKELMRQFKSILRKEAWMGNREYRGVLEDIKGIVRAISSKSGFTDLLDSGTRGGMSEADLDVQLQYYSVLLEKLESLRKVDEKKLLAFSTYLRDLEGQKYVFLFYQREFIPKINPNVYENIMSLNQDRPDIQLSALSLFEFFKRDISFNVKRVKEAFSDSSIAIHFLFFTKLPEHTPGIRMEEHSEDIFSAFNEMAKATGGISESSANPAFLFKKASDASENYYLLYYTPQNYKADGKFRNIKVKVKGKGYKVSHRSGYFAN